MSEKVWRVTVSGTTQPLTDEQREKLVNAFTGYATLDDDVRTGQFTIEFDVDADGKGSAIAQGSRLFASTAVQEVFTRPVTSVEVDAELE